MAKIKKLLALLVCVAMALTLAPGMTAWAEGYVEGETDDGLVYKLYDDHVEITGYTGDAAELIIPSEIDGLPVTVIGEDAFEDRTGLTSVTKPDSVIIIDVGVFDGCTSLTNVTIPDSVTKIGYNAFIGCRSKVKQVQHKFQREISS